MPHATSMVRFAAGPTARDAIDLLFDTIGNTEPPTVVLPATLDRRDALAADFRARLRSEGHRSRLVVPPRGVISLAAGFSSAHWKEVSLPLPDLPSSTVRLPRAIAIASSIGIVTDVDAVRGRGPFVLDLLARYLHPLDRARLLASPRRTEAASELYLAVADSHMRCLVAARLDRGVVVADTSDPIAAELVALAFADLDRPSSAEYTGPWEDQLVQRAAELQIGVLLPSDISVELTGHWPDESRQGLGLVLSSIGVSIT